MKEKILARFKEKFPGVNLSKARLNAIAVKIEGKVVDDETKIDAALDELNNSGLHTFAEIAKEDDRIRGIEAKLKQPATPPNKDPKEVNDDPPKDQPPAPPDDAPAWAKSLLESNKTMAQQLAALQGEKLQNTIKDKAKAQLKDVPEVFWSKRVLPQKEEEIEAFVTDVTTDYAAFAQTQTNNGLSALGKPAGGGGKPGNGEATKAETDAIVKELMK
jgi:hypothetical protein